METKKMSKILEDLNYRYATKKFDSTKKISKEDFNELLEALRLTPSSFGMEPWKFIVVDNKELREKIKLAAWHQSQVTDASHLIVLCARKEVSHKDIENFMARIAKTRSIEVSELKGFQDMMIGWRNGVDNKAIAEWTKKQVYIALGFLLAVAAQKRIDATPMEGFSSSEVDKILGLEKEGLVSVALCPVGYRSKDDPYIKLKKVRYSQKEVVEYK